MIAASSALASGPGVRLKVPCTSRIVYQRGQDNRARIPIEGSCSTAATAVQARLRARVEGQGISTDWVVVDATPSNGSFRGTIEGTGGWYDLEVRVVGDHQTPGSIVLERVGIGEVFIAVGHSVAAGQDINLDGASDDRVSTVPIQEKGNLYQQYILTGDIMQLPLPGFVHFDSNVQPAPFGHGTYFWARFSELVAKRENVPVLFYNAAFGGTSLEHWAKSAQGIRFEHSFVRSGIRMPYINLHNALTYYIPLTGLRAILADQGQNDWPENDANKVYDYYCTFVQQARSDLGDPSLAVVVNRQTPFLRCTQIRQAQERMIAVPNCFPGPDYDLLAREDRPDEIHLGASGAAKAAEMWATAVSGEFLRKAIPWTPFAK